MHASFADETELLQMAFATMGGISSAYVLGDILAGLQWHVFVAHGAEAADWHKPAYTLEVGSAQSTTAHMLYHKYSAISEHETILRSSPSQYLLYRG